ncbi:hypothetical protein OROHE_003433 [Orobanche hederae]
MTVDRCSWRRRIRVADSFFGGGPVVESLRVELSRLALVVLSCWKISAVHSAKRMLKA